MWVAMKFTIYNLGEVFKGTDNRIVKWIFPILKYCLKKKKELSEKRPRVSYLGLKEI